MVFGYRIDITQRWIFYKMLIALGFFLPLEILNGLLVFKYVKSEKWYIFYDKFIMLITLPLILAGLTVIYLAVFKPI